MRPAIMTVLSCVLALATGTPARVDHYEVFIVAGQSNCDGRGKAAELTGRSRSGPNRRTTS
jgi:hypothetical protein